MRIVKKPRKVVKASEEMAEEIVEETPAVDGDGVAVEVAPEATELLFETEDVAELLAEVTESEVVVDVDDETDEITFEVDGEPYVVEPEGDEAILESSKAVLKGKRTVRANRRVRASRKAPVRKPIKSSKAPVRKPIRRRASK